MDAPKRIWAWPDRGDIESNRGRWSCNVYSSDLTPEYILVTEHERLLAEIINERDFAVAQLRVVFDVMWQLKEGVLKMTSENRTNSHFTFGQDHMTNYPLPLGGKIADYWVTVSLPESMAGKHRDMFIEYFTSHHCPRPNQFAMEYDDGRFNPEYLPGGQLCVITERGISDE